MLVAMGMARRWMTAALLLGAAARAPGAEAPDVRLFLQAALTTPAGANRLYASEGVTFVRLRPDGTVEDDTGALWRVGEDALRRVDDPGQARTRVPARRAFWFGWHAQFPDTALVR